ncbi:hypothetical protein CN327_06870 [Bacillus cereus]|uniref:YopX family protein n=1 Tax=Bacillus nitratireducens TaxID=2026193 RepID=UPI000BEBE0C0|nr:YopX family protein [Bacillus nitratireducens]PEE14328.1 hypothetical protein CON53_30745 [Bacillus cereus]MED0906340.1 YopX family protein [Bacillus nitratireducens]PFF35589.1 hypothetical protein CN327_06870 [Bacillus cereus]PFH77651.1 hypothetical protein COI81_31215 [Bacillus cereus]PFI44364.1 hypothetical protein COI73_25590 [Bacillus cereus]
MKEIKFRVLHKPTNTILVQLKDSPCFGKFEGDRAVSIEDVFFYEKQDFEIMQYIGLKDKYGNEIYEGDIVQISGHPFDIDGNYEVGFNEYMELSCGSYYLFKMSNWAEVIGNIYEKPELLEN